MFSSIKLISLIGLTALIVGTEATILEDCGKEPLATVGQVSLTGCDFEKDSICNLVRGTDASISVDLTPSKFISRIHDAFYPNIT